MNVSPPSRHSHAPVLLPWKTPGIGRRLACGLYEGMLLFGVLCAAGVVYYVLYRLFARGAAAPQPGIAPHWSLPLFLLAVLGVYFCGFWCKGQTLAMKTWNIRIVNRQGRPISLAQAVARFILSWIWFAPLLLLRQLPVQFSLAEIAVLQTGWVLVWALLARLHRYGQFWHDVWARTLLVHYEHPKRSPQA